MHIWTGRLEAYISWGHKSQTRLSDWAYMCACACVCVCVCTSFLLQLVSHSSLLYSFLRHSSMGRRKRAVKRIEGESIRIVGAKSSLFSLWYPEQDVWVCIRKTGRTCWNTHFWAQTLEFWICLIWGRVWWFVFLTASQAMLVLLVLGSHFETNCTFLIWLSRDLWVIHNLQLSQTTPQFAQKQIPWSVVPSVPEKQVLGMSWKFSLGSPRIFWCLEISPHPQGRKLYHVGLQFFELYLPRDLLKL